MPTSSQRRSKLFYCCLGAVPLLIVVLGAAGSHPASRGMFPPGFPEAIEHELLADAQVQAATTDQPLISEEEAVKISSAPAAQTPLSLCQARQYRMIQYSVNWTKLTPDQQDYIANAFSNVAQAESERCAEIFDQANGYPYAAQKARQRQADNEVGDRILQQWRQTPISHPTMASADQCRWWREEIQADDRKAAEATTAELREGWDHNMNQAQNAYNEECR